MTGFIHLETETGAPLLLQIDEISSIVGLGPNGCQIRMRGFAAEWIVKNDLPAIVKMIVDISWNTRNVKP